MFGISWPELLLTGIVALIVIGPKDLPPLLRQAGKFTRQARLLYDEMRGHFDDLAQQADMADMQKQADDIQRKANAPYVGDAEPPVADTPDDGVIPGKKHD